MKKFNEIALRSSARRVPRPRLLWVGLAFAVVIAAIEAVNIWRKNKASTDPKR